MSSMKLRVLVTLLLVAVLTKLGSTQGLPDVEQKNKNQTGLFAFGGVGPAIPGGNFGKQREIGFDFNTAAEYRFASGFSLRGMFDFSSFGFGHGTLQVNNSGKTYDLSGSNNLISLLVAGGYHASSGRIQP